MDKTSQLNWFYLISIIACISAGIYVSSFYESPEVCQKDTGQVLNFSYDVSCGNYTFSGTAIGTENQIYNKMEKMAAMGGKEIIKCGFVIKGK